jgi:mannose-1-phosphate guanylyltransferase/mannose-6-phosphate isomerase
MKITPVILSGGCGSRLWPVSRQNDPKQFIDFFGENSLFQQTVMRLKNAENFNAPIVVCNNEHRFTVAEELKKISIAPKSIILEPFAKNTAPAIAAAALDILASDSKNDLMLIMPCDHLIKDGEAFLSNLQNATLAAQKDFLITFGSPAKKAETGYGYIKKGQKLAELDDVFAVEKFIEKPDSKSAEGFVASGEYLWNCGIFLFRACVYLEMLQKYAGEIFVNVIAAHNKAVRDLDFIRLDAEEFEKAPKISIDYAVMEKSSQVAVSKLDLQWSDIGSWQAIAENAPKDQNNNSLIGDCFALDSKNCYINSRDKLVAVIGVENLIVLSLRDAVLIVDKNKAQDVKKMFELLQAQNREECQYHARVLRPWGSFETIENNAGFKIKKITVKPKASISLQMHNHRAEHWVVISGTAHVNCGAKEFVLTQDQSTYIPLGKKHRLENKGRIPLEIIEVQTGSYLGEDDIIRFSDIYGR